MIQAVAVGGAMASAGWVLLTASTRISRRRAGFFSRESYSQKLCYIVRKQSFIHGANGSPFGPGGRP